VGGVAAARTAVPDSAIAGPLLPVGTAQVSPSGNQSRNRVSHRQ